MTRRDLLKRSSLLLAAPAGFRPLTAAPDKRKRLGCTTVCFRFRFPATRPSHIPQPAAGNLTLLDVPAMFADKLNLHNVELWSKHFTDTSLGYCEKVHEAARRSGSSIINIQLDDDYNLSHRDPAERNKAIDFVTQWLDRAAACGAPSLRANTGTTDGADFDLDITLDSFRRLVDYGKKINVMVLLENHGTSVPVPGKIVKIVDALHSPFCRTIPDFGNIPKDAGDDFRWRVLKMLYPKAQLASAKGMWFDDSMKHVPYDIGECVRIGERLGFRGIYSAEFWDPQHRPYDDMRVTRRIIEILAQNISA